MKRLGVFLLAAAAAGCLSDQGRRAREAVFVGIDVSGSFQTGGRHADGLKFLSHYLYGRLNELGELDKLKSLFVGPIGGEMVEEPKSFRPIHDFRGKTPEQIEADLKKWFPVSDRMSDFNIFFKQVAHIARKRNLSLTPITVILLTDGVPAVPDGAGGAQVGRYEDVDLGPLEFLSRKVTLRILYPSQPVARQWETAVPRRRVRLWVADSVVMESWGRQLKPGEPLERQDALWAWVEDTVDFRVGPYRGRRK